ncbi:hypothetical protein MW887_004224 [Aspergillus wentii]|nr:hypothetical protein MW887_004224 [Aspergillus wentii]
MSDQSVLRITRDIKQLQQSADLSLAVYCDESDVRTVSALILGPPESPYQFGFFEFAIKFGKDYPASPPTVKAVTTNGGRCRFNPNIYASGKVCLSILGTWRGESGEQWSSAQGLESILISIQSLMSANPYENEPGYENANMESDLTNMKSYIAKIRHETLRIAVMAPLERTLGIMSNGKVIPPRFRKPFEERDEEEDFGFSGSILPYDPFTDIRKRRFLWYFESYMQAIDAAEQEKPGKRKFERMPFESTGNAMDGNFDYAELRRRLTVIRMVIIHETQKWPVEGRKAQEEEAGIAANLYRQHEQIIEDFKRRGSFTVDLGLSDGNPFLWELTYFGRPMTHLDGGIFKMKVYLSPRFPEEQPRVFVETPLFHHRVSKDKVLFYLPLRTDEMRYHIEAILDALEDESPAYDPRTTVNPEATKLLWGSPDEKKQYKRALRRSVERSAEEAFA